MISWSERNIRTVVNLVNILEKPCKHLTPDCVKNNIRMIYTDLNFQDIIVGCVLYKFFLVDNIISVRVYYSPSTDQKPDQEVFWCIDDDLFKQLDNAERDGWLH